MECVVMMRAHVVDHQAAVRAHWAVNHRKLGQVVAS